MRIQTDSQNHGRALYSHTKSSKSGEGYLGKRQWDVDPKRRQDGCVHAPYLKVENIGPVIGYCPSKQQIKLYIGRCLVSWLSAGVAVLKVRRSSCWGCWATCTQDAFRREQNRSLVTKSHNWGWGPRNQGQTSIRRMTSSTCHVMFPTIRIAIASGFVVGQKSVGMDLGASFGQVWGHPRAKNYNSYTNLQCK